MGQTELTRHLPEPGIAQQINIPDGPPPTIRTARGPIIPKLIVSQVIKTYATDFVAQGGERTKGVIRGTFSDLGYSDKIIQRTLAHRDPEGRDFGWHVRKAVRRARFGGTVEPIGQHVTPIRPERGLRHYPPLQEPNRKKPPIGSHRRYHGPGAREPRPWDHIPTIDIRNDVITRKQLFSVVIQYMIDTGIRPGKREMTAQLIEGFHCHSVVVNNTLHGISRSNWDSLIQTAESLYDSLIVPDSPRRSRRDRTGQTAAAHMDNLSRAQSSPSALIKRFAREAAPQVRVARRVQSAGYHRYGNADPEPERTGSKDAEHTVVYRAPKTGSRMAMPMYHGPVRTGMRPEVVWDRGRPSSLFSESRAAIKTRSSVKEIPPTTTFRIILGEGRQIRDIQLGLDQAKLLRVLIANREKLQTTTVLAEQVGMDGYTFGTQLKILRDQLETGLPKPLIIKRSHRGGKAKGTTTTRYNLIGNIEEIPYAA